MVKNNCACKQWDKQYMPTIYGMWKSTPVLVELRQDVSAFIDTILENGDETDYVTIELLTQQFKIAHTKHTYHHIQQIIDAITDTMNNKGSNLVKHIKFVNRNKEVDCGDDIALFRDDDYYNAYQFKKFKHKQ
jgi:hypothetical protein